MIRKVFLWKPAKVERIAYGFFGGGRVVTEWQWLTTVIDVDGKLFDKDSTSLIACEIQMNAQRDALEYLRRTSSVK